MIDRFLWVDNLEAYLKAEESIQAAIILDKPQPTEEKFYQVQDGVAVIPIKGSLVNSSVPRWFEDLGYARSYQNIQQDLMQANADPSVKSILLDVNSGGGAASGVSSLSEAIKASEKPVHAFAENAMSAAYWLASSAKTLTAANTAMVGSIGTVQVHLDVSGSYKQGGIDPTVLRSGEYKALGHSMEPLSDKAKTVMQDQLDYFTKIFVDGVAANRGMSPEGFSATAGQGRVFIGQQAKDVNLVDSIDSFQTVFATVAALGNNSGQVPTFKKDQYRMEDTQEIKAESSAKIELLTSQLSAKEAALLDAKVEIVQLKAQNEQVNKNFEAMQEIALASLNQMRVSLGMTALDKVEASDLLAEHARVKQEFVSKFPVGGVAAVAPVEETEAKAEQVVKVDADYLRRIQASSTQIKRS